MFQQLAQLQSEAFGVSPLWPLSQFRKPLALYKQISWALHESEPEQGLATRSKGIAISNKKLLVTIKGIATRNT